MRKDDLLQELKQLSESVPNDIKDIFYMCLELEEIQRDVSKADEHHAGRLLDRAREIRATLLQMVQL